MRENIIRPRRNGKRYEQQQTALLLRAVGLLLDLGWQLFCWSVLRLVELFLGWAIALMERRQRAQAMTLHPAAVGTVVHLGGAVALRSPAETSPALRVAQERWIRR